jgi:hypothetical protein
MLQAKTDELRQRAENIRAALDGLPVRAKIGTGQAQIFASMGS